VDGGAYNATSYGDGPADDRTWTWKWRYFISSDELGIIEINDNIPYSRTEMDAFDTSFSTPFTLTAGANVSFYIPFGPHGGKWSGHNTGGISLKLIPLPGALWLVGSGLIALVSLRKKRNR
jgi:hypothetical protein